MSHVNWHDVARRTRARHGLLRVEDGLLTRSQIRTAVDAGILAREHTNVLRLAGAPRTEEQRTLYAVWAAAGLAAASRRSASTVWGLSDVWPDHPDVCVAPPRLPRLRGAHVHRSAALTPDRIVIVRHIPVTDPMLTVLQLGAVVARFVVEDAVERGLQRRLFTVAGLWAMLEQLGRSGRNGAGVLRAVLVDRALGDERPESLLESRMAQLLDRAGLPKPNYQFEVFDGDRFVARVDFAYPELMVVIEVDGWTVHGTPQATTLDFARQNEVELLGWTVLRFTWDMVVRRPAFVVETIARVLRARMAAG